MTCTKKDDNFSENNKWWIFGKLRFGENYTVKDAMKKGFLENGGYLLALGGHYLSFPGNWIITFLHLFTALTHFLLLGYTAILKIDDLTLASESIHFTVLLLVTISMVINGFVYQSKIEIIMRILGEGVYDYKDTLDDNSLKQINEQTEKMNHNKKLFPKLFMGMLFSAVLTTTVMRPIGFYFLNTFTNGADGVNRYLPVHCWYPVDSREPLSTFGCCIFQYFLVITIPCAVFGTDLIFLYIAEEIMLQLKKLGISLTNIIGRAEYLMKLHGEQDNLDKYISICMAHSIQHHNALSRLFKHFRDYYFFILVILFVSEGFMVCMCCLLFVSHEVSAVSKVSFFFIVSTELIHIYIMCWYGEQIKQTSASISEDMYYSDWIEHSKALHAHLLMVLQKGLKPLTLSAGGYTQASMETFANVLSTSYSYFNLLNAVNV